LLNGRGFLYLRVEKENKYVMFVVEYKVANELFARKFAYDSKCLDAQDGLLYINSIDATELTINRKFLEYRIERIMREGERFDQTNTTK